jgi:hypothetical protein
MKSGEVQARHPRFQVHFTPTNSNWLNLIERWFRELTDKRVRRSVFRSVRELIDGSDKYIEHHNDQTDTVRAGPPRPNRSSPNIAVPKPTSISSHLIEARH